MHAMKAAGLWNRVTGTASQEGDYNLSLEQKTFYFNITVHWAKVCGHGDELYDA